MSITVTPAGTISLCRTNLENDYKNTLTWSNINAQTNYFNGLSNKLSLSDYTYMKKDGKIRFYAPIDEIINYNYCYYNNGGFTTKRYYCFITRMEYVNENLTDVFIETDVFQTWYFDIVWNRCFVEREHVNNDSIGANTIPENIEHGEYVNHDDIVRFGVGTCHAVICVSEDPFRQDANYPSQVINGVPTGLHYFVVGDFTSVSFIGWLVDWASDKSDLSLINSIYMVPDSLTNYGQGDNYWSYALNEGGLSYAPYHKLESNIGVVMGNTTINKPYNSIDSYIPKNNKLFCYPYNFLMVDNNGGNAFEYRYENFNSDTCVFHTVGAITPGCSIKTIPMNYEHIQYNHSCSLPAMKLPVGSWSGDVYTNWLTQNSVNIGASIASDVGSIALGGAMLSSGMAIGGAGSVISGVTGIAGTIGTVYQHSRIPNQVFGSTNSGDINFANGNMNFTAYYRTIKYEYAKLIDEYFSAYGYKVDTIKVPNITGRSQWNFIKTIDCNADGNIPQEDLDTIKKACNAGITFWHNPANMYNYSLSNTIV